MSPRSQAHIDNADKQTLFLSLLILLEIFVDELPEGKDPERGHAIREMTDVLRMRVVGLQQEAQIMQEADNETSH